MSEQRFSDVALKMDGTFVVTIAGNRCHVTRTYDPDLFTEVEVYLAQGGASRPYADDVVVATDPTVLAKLWSDEQLAATDTLVSQYRDDLDLGEPTDLTKEQYTELLQWRKSLRSWQEVEGYPAESTRPQQPEWMTEA